MGIEPTLSAWEAEVLPLNYARPVPKDGQLPRRACPLRDGLKQTCLATGHHTEVSALSSRGDRCIPYPDLYSPAFAFSAILYPQQMRLILQPRLSRLAARLCFGLTLFPATSTSQEPHLSAGDRFVSVSPPSRETSDHVPFWSEPVSRFGSLKLDGIYQWFTYVGPLTQPCASSGFRLPESRACPHGHRVPVEGGYVVGALGTRSLPTRHCT